jgi:hypothetical protein
VAPERRSPKDSASPVAFRREEAARRRRGWGSCAAEACGPIPRRCESPRRRRPTTPVPPRAPLPAEEERWCSPVKLAPRREASWNAPARAGERATIQTVDLRERSEPKVEEAEGAQPPPGASSCWRIAPWTGRRLEAEECSVPATAGESTYSSSRAPRRRRGLIRASRQPLPRVSCMRAGSRYLGARAFGTFSVYSVLARGDRHCDDRYPREQGSAWRCWRPALETV